MSRRPGTASDRDVLIRKTPPRGVAEQLAAPHEIPDEVTGRYEGEELAHWRSRRPTDVRMAHIEKGLDEVRAEQKRQADSSTEQLVMIGDIKGALGEMRGELRTALNQVTLTQTEQGKTERARIGSRAKVIVGVCTMIGAVAGVVATLVAGGCS